MAASSSGTQAPIADARTYSAAALAVTGLVLWALQAYVFKHDVPSAVTADVYVIVPAIVGYVAAHFTRLYTRPVLPPPPPAPPATRGGGGGGGGEYSGVTVT